MPRETRESLWAASSRINVLQRPLFLGGKMNTGELDSHPCRDAAAEGHEPADEVPDEVMARICDRYTKMVLERARLRTN